LCRLGIGPRFWQQAGRSRPKERNPFCGEDARKSLHLGACVRWWLTSLRTDGNHQQPSDRARAIRDWVARHGRFIPRHSLTLTTAPRISASSAGETWAGRQRNAFSGRMGSRRGYGETSQLMGTRCGPASRDAGYRTGLRADDVYDGKGGWLRLSHARHRVLPVLPLYLSDNFANTLWAAADCTGCNYGHTRIIRSRFIPGNSIGGFTRTLINQRFVDARPGEPLSPLTAGHEHDWCDRSGTPELDLWPQLRSAVYGRPDIYLGVSQGFPFLGDLVARVDLSSAWSGHRVQIVVPALAKLLPGQRPKRSIRVCPRQEAFPTLGVVLSDVSMEDSVYVVRLSSTFPVYDHFDAGWRVRAGSPLPT